MQYLAYTVNKREGDKRISRDWRAITFISNNRVKLYCVDRAKYSKARKCIHIILIGTEHRWRNRGAGGHGPPTFFQGGPWGALIYVIFFQNNTAEKCFCNLISYMSKPEGGECRLTLRTVWEGIGLYAVADLGGGCIPPTSLNLTIWAEKSVSTFVFFFFFFFFFFLETT